MAKQRISVFFVLAVIASFLFSTHLISASTAPLKGTKIKVTAPIDAIQRNEFTKFDAKKLKAKLVPATTQTLPSFGAFLFMDWSLRKVFKKFEINFPSSLCGMMIMFFGLLGLERASPTHAAKTVKFLEPGFDQLTKWLPTFFVPGVVMMPLSPPISTENIIRLLLINSVGLIINFFFSSNVAQSLIKISGASASGAAPAPAAAGGKKKDPYPMKMGKALFVISLITSALACVTDSPQMYTLGLLSATVGGFVCATHMPASVKTIVSPFIVSSIVGLIACGALSTATGTDFKDMVRNYTRKQGGLQMGAGDILLGLLGPSILSFGLSMYHRRQLMAKNFSVVIGTNFCSAVFSLLGTALLARIIGLKESLRTSTVMRNVTMALGLPLFEMIKGNNVSVAVAMIILTGVLGQNFGQIIMNKLKVRNPVARGLSMGISGHGLGTAALAATEKEAFAFSALAMALNGSFAVCLTAIPAFRRLILAVAGVSQTV